MPLPISRTQLDKLGKRLAASDQPAAEDLALLSEVMRTYQRVLDAVEETLRAEGFLPSSRVKTNSTLIDKLNRQSSLGLSQVQDVAGARITGEGGLDWQDEVVARLCEIFKEISRKPVRVVDRRLKPSHGYRAVHVIVFPEDVPVEIQVRTTWQGHWAQFVEHIGDDWGRGLRYGEVSELQKDIIDSRNGQVVTRFDVVEKIIELSDRIYQYESEYRDFGRRKDTHGVSVDIRLAQQYFRRKEQLLGDIMIVLGVLAAKQGGRKP